MHGRGGLGGMLDRALDLGTASRREFLVNDLSGRRSPGPVALIPGAQDFTNAWATGALGPEISVDGFTRISLWFVLDAVHDSLLIDFRCVGRHTSGGADHPMPIYNPVVAATPYNILVEQEYVRLNNVAPINMVLTWDISNTMPFIAMQIMANLNPAGGVTYAHLASAHVTYGWGS
jgi:hypothetical protein